MRLVFLFFVVFLFACKKSPVGTSVYQPSVACSLVRMITNPGAVTPAETDTVFFVNGKLTGAVSGEGRIKYTYRQDKLLKRETFGSGGELIKISAYEHNPGAGQLLYQYDYNADSPKVVKNTTAFSYTTMPGYIDRILELTDYEGGYTPSRRLVITWDGALENIQNISVRDASNNPVASYNFSSSHLANPLTGAFNSNIYLFVADPSGYDDAVRVGLFLSRKEVTKITSTLPGFAPLNITYTYTNNNVLKELLINGKPKWKFEYGCD